MTKSHRFQPRLITNQRKQLKSSVHTALAATTPSSGTDKPGTSSSSSWDTWSQPVRFQSRDWGWSWEAVLRKAGPPPWLSLDSVWLTVGSITAPLKPTVGGFHSSPAQKHLLTRSHRCSHHITGKSQSPEEEEVLLNSFQKVELVPHK